MTLDYQWSRFSGGSGAPYWTLIACGLNPKHFTATQASIIHSEYPGVANPDPASIPAMTWSTNYGRLASQTLFTFFFSGRDFAPRCIIDGQNIQDYLQSHFIAAYGELADRIRDAGDLLDECVIGWDSMNEPFEGFCRYPDLSKTSTTMKKGSQPTPIQSFRLGMGQKQTVENWKFGGFGPQRDGSVTVDPQGLKVWADPEIEDGDGVNGRWGWRRDPGWKLGTCIWAQHGIWDIESGELLRPDYFKSPPWDTGRGIVFVSDYWRPHFHKYMQRIRQSHPESIMFVQPPVFELPPSIDEADLRGRACYSAHYYDGLTLVTRHWNWFNADALGILRGKYSSPVLAVKVGEQAIRKSIQEQLGVLKSDVDIVGPYPTVIGEIGIPFDMDGRRSYGWTDDGKYAGDYTRQVKALDASLNAADGPNGLNYTIWTYCPDSSHTWGDGWNMEDLSLWSSDDLRRKGEYIRESRNTSAADLLVKHKMGAPFVNESAVASSISLSTLNDATNVGAASTLTVGSKPITSLENWDNPYDFLTDGARAVRAFSRPYPTAVVGVPVDVQFDIAKAEFKLTVRVRGVDAPVPSTVTSSSLADEKEEVPTEIYVPLVHYANEKIVAKFSCAQEEGGGERDSRYDTVSLSGDVSGVSTSTSATTSTLTSSLGLSSPLSDSTLLPTTPLDLAVRVSDGRWEVEGQMLRWWYTVPAEPEEEREYTIWITRASGPIKALDDLREPEGCFEQFCAGLCEGCRVM